mmetsp:Transcript_23487/g.89226  ORF Transcript_23487/g.89226 Transcript_23487/m.89226 type:complete len:486 (+) Transcript_23487:10096-11553(+)
MPHDRMRDRGDRQELWDAGADRRSHRAGRDHFAACGAHGRHPRPAAVLLHVGLGQAGQRVAHALQHHVHRSRGNGLQAPADGQGWHAGLRARALLLHAPRAPPVPAQRAQRPRRGPPSPARHQPRHRHRSGEHHPQRRAMRRCRAPHAAHAGCVHCAQDRGRVQERVRVRGVAAAVLLRRSAPRRLRVPRSLLRPAGRVLPGMPAGSRLRGPCVPAVRRPGLHRVHRAVQRAGLVARLRHHADGGRPLPRAAAEQAGQVRRHLPDLCALRARRSVPGLQHLRGGVRGRAVRRVRGGLLPVQLRVRKVPGHAVGGAAPPWRGADLRLHRGLHTAAQRAAQHRALPRGHRLLPGACHLRPFQGELAVAADGAVPDPLRVQPQPGARQPRVHRGERHLRPQVHCCACFAAGAGVRLRSAPHRQVHVQPVHPQVSCGEAKRAPAAARRLALVHDLRALPRGDVAGHGRVQLLPDQPARQRAPRVPAGSV